MLQIEELVALLDPAAHEEEEEEEEEGEVVEEVVGVKVEVEKIKEREEVSTPVHV